MVNDHIHLVYYHASLGRMKILQTNTRESIEPAFVNLHSDEVFGGYFTELSAITAVYKAAFSSARHLTVCKVYNANTKEFLVTVCQ